MSPRRFFRHVVERMFGNEFERALRRAARLDAPRVLLFWNRGLGDIVLGLATLLDRLRAANARVSISVLTRADLADGFRLVGVDEILAAPALRRGDREGFARACAERGAGFLAGFDIVLRAPDPTRWLAGHPAAASPRLSLPHEWSDLWQAIPGLRHDGPRIAAHVSSETGQYYGYRKDWPSTCWRELFSRHADRDDLQWLLLGNAADGDYSFANVLDLRGRTGFPELMSLLCNGIDGLIAVDSGILCFTWCLTGDRPLDLVSLWADPKQGILKMGTPPTNPALRHTALVGDGNRVENIAVATVEQALPQLFAPNAEIAALSP